MPVNYVRVYSVYGMSISILLVLAGIFMVNLGVALAIVASVITSFAVFGFKWGSELSRGIRKLGVSAAKGKNVAMIDLFGLLIAVLISNLLSSILHGAVGVVVRETVDWTSLFPAVAAGIVTAVGGTLWRMANLTTKNLGVNAIAYGTPILSLIWLWVFMYIGSINVGYLVVGGAAIITANLLINFEADRLIGFKALVISLWACGTLVYLRDDAIWEWAAKSGGYFDVLFLSATVFALILSFRTVRLASRTQEEDNRAFKVFRELEELERRGVISPGAEIYKHILTIDEKQGQKLEDAYGAARRAISDALITAEGPDRKKLIAISIELDTLAHSRQQGINFGEICALFIFAGLVVGTALISRPAEVSGLTGFLVEMFAMLFPAVILFLAFNVLDLQRDRVSQILVSNTQYSGYGVAFQDTESQEGTIRHTSRRFWEQRISIAVGVALIAAYAGLFLYKWELLHKWGIL